MNDWQLKLSITVAVLVLFVGIYLTNSYGVWGDCHTISLYKLQSYSSAPMLIEDVWLCEGYHSNTIVGDEILYITLRKDEVDK